MLLKGNNCPSEQVRKRNTITKLLTTADLQIEDDYSKFHDTVVIEAISRYIVAQTDTKGDMKRKLMRYIKELATCGTNIDPDHYKANVILNLPKVEKTKKAEKILINLIQMLIYWKFLTLSIPISKTIQMLSLPV